MLTSTGTYTSTSTLLTREIDYDAWNLIISKLYGKDACLEFSGDEAAGIYTARMRGPKTNWTISARTRQQLMASTMYQMLHSMGKA